jgi:hypothetical protein
MKVAGSALRKMARPGRCLFRGWRREEERKKQGLPPRLGVLPHSEVAEEEDRWEAEQERKKERSKKRGK